METDSLREDLFYLAGFLLTSACGLYHEPGEYGIYRLMDAAGRLLTTLESHGLSDAFLQHLSEELETEKADSMDSDRQQATLNRIVMEYSEELQRRLAAT